MKRVIGWLTVLMLAASALAPALVWGRIRDAPAVRPLRTEPVGAWILDAGHGGEDGGAVSVTGAHESQINLAIVLKLRDILGLYGAAPVLLRSEDVMLADKGLATMRERKSSDLKNRAKAVQQIKNGVLVSVHQNSFPEGRYRGAQVFYAPTPQSQELAHCIQSAVKRTMQPDNNREIKKIPNTVYLMNHVDCPAVLVECGFLTNPEEEALLRDQEYQTKLAAVISAALLAFQGSSEETT